MSRFGRRRRTGGGPNDLPLPGLSAAFSGSKLRKAESDFLAHVEATSKADLGKRKIRAQVLRHACLFARQAGNAGPGRLTIEGGKVDGDLDLVGLRLDCGLRFIGTKLEGVLLNDTRLLALELLGGRATHVHADRIEVTHDLVMSNGFACEGSVGLRSAAIGGDLNLDGSKLATGKVKPPALRERGVRESSALNFDGARIGARVFLRRSKGRPFRAHRPVRGLNARVGGAILCNGALFDRGLALTRTQVEGEVSLDGADIGSVPALGEPRPDARLLLGSMRIAGGLSLGGTRFRGPYITLEQTQVGGRLNWSPRWTNSDAKHLRINLRQTRVGYLQDDLDSWHGAEVVLEGFSLGGVAVGSGDWLKQRKTWLECQPKGEWSPQPYDQIRASLRDSGHESKARDIAIAREKVRGKRGGLDGPAKLAHGAYGLLLAYGYRPFRILWISALIVFALWPAYCTLDTCHLPAVGAQCGQFEAPGAGSPHFHALLFSIDTFLPIDLGQTGAWQPSEAGFAWLVAAETTVGWLFAALLLGAVTGILRRD
jgi:hypothetical protein